MSLHLIKLCVGADTVEDLVDWQKRFSARRRAKGDPVLFHGTRMTPKRRDEVLDGGSIYWVIRGLVRVRQRILDLDTALEDGRPICRIVLDAKLVPTVSRPRRPFQGWRYLEAADAPPDLPADAADMPGALREELAALGLL